MTAILSAPKPRKTSACDVAINNINMIIAVRHIAKKDIANAMGKVPQAFSRMLKPGYHWTFDDMLMASDVIGVSLNDLTDPNLTPAKVLQIQKTAAPNGNDGQLVAGHGFEPWTSGDTRGPRFKSMVLLSLSSKLILTA